MPIPVHQLLEDLIKLREATPGKPEDGPYPATVGEVADEIVTFIRELEVAAPGLTVEVYTRLREGDSNV